MTERPARPSASRGFSLLEALVALSVLTLSYAVIMQVLGGAARNVDSATDYRHALILAESRLASLRAGYEFAADEGAVRTEDGFEVAVTTEPFSADDAVESFLQPQLVTVDVTWGGRVREHRVSVSTASLPGARR